MFRVWEEAEGESVTWDEDCKSVPEEVEDVSTVSLEERVSVSGWEREDCEGVADEISERGLVATAVGDWAVEESPHAKVELGSWCATAPKPDVSLGIFIVARETKRIKAAITTVGQQTRPSAQTQTELNWNGQPT